MTMANNNGLGVHPGMRISAQQVALIVVSILALIFMITTLAALNTRADAGRVENERYELLMARFDDEVSALDILLRQQENESGDARVATLHEMIKHIYAADALSIYKVEAFGGDALMTTETYTELTELVNQCIVQLQSGNRPDQQLAEVGAALDALRGGADEA